jgi:hypothetical protein
VTARRLPGGGGEEAGREVLSSLYLFASHVFASIRSSEIHRPSLLVLEVKILPMRLADVCNLHLTPPDVFPNGKNGMKPLKIKGPDGLTFFCREGVPPSSSAPPSTTKTCPNLHLV